MDKAKFKEAQELQKYINHKQLMIESIRKAEIGPDTVIWMETRGAAKVDLHLPMSAIKDLVRDHILNMEKVVKSLEAKFDAL